MQQVSEATAAVDSIRVSRVAEAAAAAAVSCSACGGSLRLTAERGAQSQMPMVPPVDRRRVRERATAKLLVRCRLSERLADRRRRLGLRLGEWPADQRRESEGPQTKAAAAHRDRQPRDGPQSERMTTE